MTPPWLSFGLAVTAGVALLAALLLGSAPIGLGDVLTALSGSGPASTATIVWDIRLPRALAAFVVGAGLGLAGAALQALLRNPLADPGVLGVSAMASLTASTALYFGLVALSAWVLPLAAIGGALLATALLALAALRTTSVVSLLLVGVGLSSFCGALMALLLNMAPNPFSLADLVNWMLGTVANRSLQDLTLALPFALVGAAIVLGQRAALSALALGEDAAHGVGVNVPRLRTLVVVGTGLVTGATVSLAGAVGFVGLLAPHAVRPLVGHDAGRALLPAALLGGVIVVLADIVVRLAPTDSELKLGVVAALIGAPAFVWIAVQRQGSHV